MFFSNAQKGVHHWWMFVVGAVVVSLGYIIGQMPLSMVLTYKKNQDPALDSNDLLEFAEHMDFAKFGISANFGLVLSLLIFVVALAFLYFVVFIFHKRNFTSLINYFERVDWRRLFWGFGVWFSISLVMEFISYYLSPENYEFVAPGQEYLILLLICLIMLPLQTSFEELFFRGYLMQAIGYFTRSKWLAMLVISLLFMSIHLANPEIEQYGTINMVIYYFTSGLILAFITIMDDRLELAMGIHLANNFFGATLVTYEGAALQTNSLYTVHEINPQMMVLGFSVVAFIFIILASRRFKWQSIGKSFKWTEQTNIKTL